MLSYTALGNNIQRARMRRGLTQEQVAARMNVTFTYYGRYERGEAKPSLDRLAEICEILSVPIEDMFIGTYDTSNYEKPISPDAVVTSFLRLMTCSSEKQKEAISKICEGITSLSIDK